MPCCMGPWIEPKMSRSTNRIQPRTQPLWHGRGTGAGVAAGAPLLRQTNVAVVETSVATVAAAVVAAAATIVRVGVGVDAGAAAGRGSDDRPSTGEVEDAAGTGGAATNHDAPGHSARDSRDSRNARDIAPWKRVRTEPPIATTTQSVGVVPTSYATSPPTHEAPRAPAPMPAPAPIVTAAAAPAAVAVPRMPVPLLHLHAPAASHPGLAPVTFASPAAAAAAALAAFMLPKPGTAMPPPSYDQGARGGGVRGGGARGGGGAPWMLQRGSYMHQPYGFVPQPQWPPQRR